MTARLPPAPGRADADAPAPPGARPLVRVHPRDDVAVAVVALRAGDVVPLHAGGPAVTVREDVPAGHKVALRALAAGAPVHKYGHPIGRASADVAAGCWVHAHNLVTALRPELPLAWSDRGPPPAPVDVPAGDAGRTFAGYRRPDGRVGTRNELWILPTVGCVNAAAARLAAVAGARLAGRVDGVHAFPHPYGCSQLGDDLADTRRLLAALVRHPNAGGVLLLGLGCENNQAHALVAEVTRMGGVAPERLRVLATQEVADEHEAGLAALAALADVAAHDRRTPCGLDALVVALKCGGSDGLSGLTANPLVGRVAERLCAVGGIGVLSEVPEMFGAERVLFGRAADRATFDAAAAMASRFRAYFVAHGQPVHENPSPGNHDGGITTLEEKSLGAVQKGGGAPVVQVCGYGVPLDPARRGGLALVEAPGNDAVSSTAMTAAGATLLLFTTGRGTPLGAPVPTLKIASNSALAARKPTWIDCDAGRLVSAGESGEALADALLDQLCATASGAPTCSERLGTREIALWKRGVTL